MERFIVIGGLRKKWNTAQYVRYAAEKIGFATASFDPLQKGASEAALFQTVEETRPDYALIMKGVGFKPEWSEALKKRGICVILWHSDTDIPNWLVPLIRSVDFCFTMAEGTIPQWKACGARRVAWLSEGFEPSFFEVGSLTEADRRSFGSDITFVGNIDSSNGYLFRRYKLKRVLREGFHLRWWGPRLGRKLINIPVILSSLGRAYGGRPVHGPEFAKVALSSKIFLAFDRDAKIRLSMSERMYMAVGCGAFYMCEAVEGIESVLVPDKEIVTFKGEDEMIEKIRYYLPRESERRTIARAGQARVLREYTYRDRLEQMFRIVKG